ncbi:site-specific integrase [Pseudoxanthomonas sp. CF125]|uniref:tyrosine-type recombinase/integrase n=1 Tax=Pseudoxanthomonas sp. CF125 TaxID=1855303 RepID=UPI00088FF6F8|nr:site-specific integrase [Pseudoxanthomonas sp. CF125]SDQ41785.1 Integrase [Pseudoxanthomonas sp. CF125]
MARPINKLSAKAVAAAKQGYHGDGGGLYLLVGPTGTKSWVLRYQKAGKRREMGLGSAAVVSLLEARQAALQQRKVLAAGVDPIASRRAAQAVGMTFGEAADAYIESHKASWKNESQADQWTQSLKDHGPDRSIPVAQVDTAVVLRCLKAIWSDKTETATRVRGRIERVLDWAKVTGLREGENPARWRGHLDKLLPKPSKLKKVKHHAAMPYSQVPALMAQARERSGIARVALQFTVLTAVRTNEVTGAVWSEFDLQAKVWTIPAERMKGGKEHRVPLTDAAIALLKRLPRNKPPFALSENGMLNVLRQHLKHPYTVHGFRSSFRDWSSEKTAFAGEVVEMALAHAITNKVEAAYRRGDLLEKRRELMQAWADYLA